MVVVTHHRFMEDIVAIVFHGQCHLSATNCYYFSDQMNQVQLEDLKYFGMALLKVRIRKIRAVRRSENPGVPVVIRWA